jgi:hypothetical protein
VPDQGESLGTLVGLKPPAPVLADDVIVADGIGDLIIRRDAFPAYFAPDLAADKA